MQYGPIALAAISLVVACGSRSDLVDSRGPSSSEARPAAEASATADAGATLGAAVKVIGTLAGIAETTLTDAGATHLVHATMDPACIGKPRGTPCNSCDPHPDQCASNAAAICDGQGACVSP